MNSETPRTDAEVFEAVCAPGPSFAQVFDVVKAEYARTLERDLAAAQEFGRQSIERDNRRLAELAAATRDLKACRELLEEAGGNDCYQYDKYLNPVPCGKCLSCRCRALLARLSATVEKEERP